jgi:DNA replication and repair protein RecF
LRAAEQLRSEVATLVFTPDRLAVVKGGPAVRRAYFDRALGRLAPARAQLSTEYAAVVAQRNAALRRVAGGYSSRDALAPWTEQVATLGGQLVESRGEVLACTGSGVRRACGRARAAGCSDEVRGRAADGRLRSRRGSTVTWNAVRQGSARTSTMSCSRAERATCGSFGSQGEQRLTVLALLLAEAELIAERRGFAPLLLLDDVLSELDPNRRRVLAERVQGAGQTLVTATQSSSLPLEPSQLLEVTPGVVRAA